MDEQFKLEQVSIRLHHDRTLYSEHPLDNAQAVVRFLQKELCDYDKEHFVVVNMNARCQPINLNVVSVGTLTSSLVDPSQVFKSSILSNAASMILAHNHPSGGTDPSKEDFLVTRRLVAASEILGIKVLDHIVVGHEEYFSFQENKSIDEMYDEFFKEIQSKLVKDEIAVYNDEEELDMEL